MAKANGMLVALHSVLPSKGPMIIVQLNFLPCAEEGFVVDHRAERKTKKIERGKAVGVTHTHALYTDAVTLSMTIDSLGYVPILLFLFIRI
jgi:hypothetical protein